MFRNSTGDLHHYKIFFAFFHYLCRVISYLMAKKITLFLLSVMLLTANIKAQAPVDVFARLQSNQPGQGSIQIKQHQDITSLVNLHISLMSSLRGIKGYRVCIYYNSGQEARVRSDQERAKFISRYEDISSDKVFESPFFKVYVGNFRSKSEALKFLERIRVDYPNAFIRENITVEFPD
jgi:SPOR domain